MTKVVISILIVSVRYVRFEIFMVVNTMVRSILTNILKNLWVPVYQTTWYGAASQKSSLK